MCSDSIMATLPKVNLKTRLTLCCPVPACKSISKSLNAFQKHLRRYHKVKGQITEDQERVYRKNYVQYVMERDVVKKALAEFESPKQIVKKFKDFSEPGNFARSLDKIFNKVDKQGGDKNKRNETTPTLEPGIEVYISENEMDGESESVRVMTWRTLIF